MIAMWGFMKLPSVDLLTLPKMHPYISAQLSSLTQGGMRERPLTRPGNGALKTPWRFRTDGAGYERRMTGIDDPGLVPEPSPPPDEGTLPTPPPDEGTPTTPPPDEGTLPSPDPPPDVPEAD